jgi:DNA-binding transcriptional ArsR family regulator
MRPLSDEQTGRIVARGHALADATRVRIIYLLAKSELTVGRVAAALAAEPSTISKHLQVLYRAGLVARRRSASTVVYSLEDQELIEVCRYLARPRSRPDALV